ncbi:MAG: hypothetical protein KF752_10290 [Pirellulaceae bacterium]|nr:hypothetical protein [Pirellulaceae bacterium]
MYDKVAFWLISERRYVVQLLRLVLVFRFSLWWCTAIASGQTENPSPSALDGTQSANGRLAGQVRVILSSQDNSHSLTEMPSLKWQTTPPQGDAPVVEVDASKRRQSILGLGASLEHATCENLSKLSTSARDDVLRRLVDPEYGIGMNLMRVCIGASDFIGEPYYTYNDVPEGQTDPELENFSIDSDRRYVLPIIQRAIQLNPNLLIFASPWSPPAWMKDSGRLGTGSLKPEYYATWAKYLLKFIEAYQQAGVPIYAITVQNEPQHTDLNYPTTLWTGEQQRDFIRDHLGPLFKQHGITTRIWCWDHNWNQLEFPLAVLEDPQAAQYVDGTAFHHYEGRVQAQSQLHQRYPNKSIYFTEGSVFRTRGALQLIDILRNWARSYNAWVVMLDEHRRPNRGPHSASATCIELLDDGQVRYNFDYYMQGQFMKFIRRGAVYIESSESDLRSFRNVVLQNPDGQLVMVAGNSSRQPQRFVVEFERQWLVAELPPLSVATYLW